MNPRLLPLGRISLRMQRDERLAELVGLGSEAAFEVIVHRYRPPLVRHCALVVGRDDADEAVQDALLKAHRALSAGTTVYSLGSWLHAIAHNSALMLLRSRRPAAEYREEHDVARSAIESGGEAQGEQLDALVSALLTLPIRQRRALVMRELEGRTYAEIGAQLGASHGAVRQLLNRARSSVRERLAALIPAVELALRLASATGGAAPSGALTLAGGGAFAAKLSSAVLLSAMPVVAVSPVPGNSPGPGRVAAPAPAHAREATQIHAQSRPAQRSAPRPTAHVVVPLTPRPVSAPAQRWAAAPRCRTATSARPSRPAGSAGSAASAGPAGSASRHGGPLAPSESGSGSPTMVTATMGGAGSGRPGPPA